MGGAIGGGGCGDEVVELADEELEVAVDVGLELGDGFGGEGVGDNLALASVFGAVAGVEEASLDAYEGIVEVAVPCISSLNPAKTSKSLLTPSSTRSHGRTQSE